MSRIALSVAACSIALIVGHAEAAASRAPTLSINAVSAERGAEACPSTNCLPAYPEVPESAPVLAGRHACVGTTLVDAAPAYHCSVYVGGSFSGRPPAEGVSVKLTLEITSDDGSPWFDDVRRTMRAQPALTQPPVAGAPAPCAAVPNADARVTCAKVGPRTWKVSATTSSKTGLFTVPLQIAFPASTSTEPVCEYLRLKGTAKSGGKTAKVDLGRRRYCA